MYSGGGPGGGWNDMIVKVVDIFEAVRVDQRELKLVGCGLQEFSAAFYVLIRQRNCGCSQLYNGSARLSSRLKMTTLVER